MDREIKEIFSCWNEQGIVIHRSIDRYERHISAVLKHYSVDEVISAIRNYGIILKSDKCFWTYKWDLRSWLLRGMDKFMDENNPFQNFCVKRNGTNESPEMDGLEEPPNVTEDFKKKFLEEKRKRMSHG